MPRIKYPWRSTQAAIIARVRRNLELAERELKKDKDYDFIAFRGQVLIAAHDLALVVEESKP